MRPRRRNTVREIKTTEVEADLKRRLAYAAGEPVPRRIMAARGQFASRWSEQIMLLEQNEKLQRVRSLALPQKAADGGAWRGKQCSKNRSGWANHPQRIIRSGII